MKLKLFALEANFFKVPNLFVDGDIFNRLNASELKVLIYLMRHTFGFQRTWVRRSIGYIAAQCGISRESAKRALSELRQKGIVLSRRQKRQSDGMEFGRTMWALNKSVEVSSREVEPIDDDEDQGGQKRLQSKGQKRPQGGSEMAPKLGSGKTPQRKTKKETPAEHIKSGIFAPVMDLWYQKFEKLHGFKPTAEVKREGVILKKLISDYPFTHAELHNMVERLFWICKLPLKSESYLKSRGFYFRTIIAHWASLDRENPVGPEELQNRYAANGQDYDAA